MAASSTSSERGSELGNTTQGYLELAVECMKKVDIMISNTLKFNHLQCQYLADKLKMAIGSAESFLELHNTSSSSYEGNYIDPDLEVFSILLSLGREVEGFVEGCSCKPNWIQSTLLLANAYEYTCLYGVNLEFCTKVFLGEEEIATLPRMTFDRFSYKSLTSRAIAKVVRQKADLDEERLMYDANVVLQSSISGSQEWQLASLLLRRLLSPGSSEAYSENLDKNLEQIEDGMLGGGASATLYEARWFGEKVAKKAFHVGNGDGAKENLSFLQEVSILAQLHHPNVLSLLCCGPHLESKWCIVMECMDGNLLAFMQKRMNLERDASGLPFTFLEALHAMLEVGEGMLYLHENQILHRDLKSQNILVKYEEVGGVKDALFHIKVADFGLSKVKEKSMAYSNHTQNRGTLRWMAPEMFAFAAKEYGTKVQHVDNPFKCDVYSFGIVCYEILTGQSPFQEMGDEEVRKKVKSGQRPVIPRDCPPRLKKLIRACWKAEPSLRPHFGDICVELREMKRDYLMDLCWSQMCGQIRSETKDKSGHPSVLEIRGQNMGDIANDDNPTHHTYVGIAKWPFAMLLKRELVMVLKKESALSLTMAMLLPILAGILVSLFHGPNMWFLALSKPWITRPIFGLVWIMHPIFGLAFWLVWVNGGFGRDNFALIAPTMQFAFMFLWSLHFFTDHSINHASADILGVNFFSLACQGGFMRVSPRSCAGSLMKIYLYWSFCLTFLTFYIYVANRGHASKMHAT